MHKTEFRFIRKIVSYCGFNSMVCQAEIRELTGMLQRSYKRKMRSSRLLILDIYTSQKASTSLF